MLNRNYNETEKINITVGVQIFLLIGIAVIYISMLFISAYSIGLTIQQFLESNIVAVLDLLSVSTFLLSAYAINEYRKDRYQQLLFYAYLIIFVSQLIQSNFLVGALMGFYLIKYVRIYNFKEVLNNLDKGKGISVFSLSILILLISILIAYIKNVAL